MQAYSECFPNLFIPAAQKSGTTALYHFLKLHPLCLVQKRHSHDMFSNASRRKNLSEYWKTYPIDKPEEGKCFKYICDTTPHYLFQENFSYHLDKVIRKETKFIVLLRDPMERAHSAYWHMRLNDEERRTAGEVFELKSSSKKEIIEEENQNLESALRNEKIDVSRTKKQYDDPLWNFRYLNNSLYSEHLETFLETFNRDNILILFTSELEKQAEQTMDKICNFLNIKTINPQDFFSSPTKATLIPRFYKFSEMMKKIYLKFFGSSKVVKQAITKILYQRRPEVDQKYQEKLTPVLQKEYSDLKKLLNRKPPVEWIRI